MSAVVVMFQRLPPQQKTLTIVAAVVLLYVVYMWWKKHQAGKKTEGFSNSALSQTGNVFMKLQDVELNVPDTTNYLVQKYANGDASQLNMEMREIDITDDSQLMSASKDPNVVGIQFTTTSSKGFLIRAQSKAIARDAWFSKSSSAYRKMAGSTFLLKVK